MNLTVLHHHGRHHERTCLGYTTSWTRNGAAGCPATRRRRYVRVHSTRPSSNRASESSRWTVTTVARTISGCCWTVPTQPASSPGWFANSRPLSPRARRCTSSDTCHLASLTALRSGPRIITTLSTGNYRVYVYTQWQYSIVRIFP